MTSLKRMLVVGCLGVAVSLALPTEAKAYHGCGSYYGGYYAAPVYVAPPPVYYAPPPVYCPPPVYYSRPYYGGSSFYFSFSSRDRDYGHRGHHRSYRSHHDRGGRGGHRYSHRY